MRHIWILATLLLTQLTGCLSTAVAVSPQPDKALLVMGFSTELVMPYEGGHLYTGFHATDLDGKTLNPPLQKKSHLALTPGTHRLNGQCYWRLRGNLSFPEDLAEPGVLEWTAKAGYIYTVASEIDEYKMQCQLSVHEKPWQ